MTLCSKVGNKKGANRETVVSCYRESPQLCLRGAVRLWYHVFISLVDGVHSACFPFSYLGRAEAISMHIACLIWFGTCVTFFF